VQQRQSFRKPDLMIEFDEANDVTAAAATIAIEQVLVWVYEQAGLVVGVERT
jgi:hypothetical protein